MTVFNTNDCTCSPELYELCGERFTPTKVKRLHATFDLRNTSVGVTVEELPGSMRIVFNPTLQVPVYLADAFEKFAYSHDDPRMVDMTVDTDDGELRMVKHARTDKTVVEAVIKENLAFLDEIACPASLAYIREGFEKLDD